MTQAIIGFDAKRIVRNATGLGNYGRTLVNALDGVLPAEVQLRLYAPDEGRQELRAAVASSPRLSWCYPQGRPLSLQRSWWRISSIVSDLRRDGVRLYHGLTGELPIGISRSGIRSVVTIHDLIFLRHPEFYHWIDIRIYAWKFRQTIREADHIIAISECTKRDIMKLGGVSENRISVVYQSCAPRFSTVVGEELKGETRQRYQLPERFILSVGSIEERKNMLLAVRALAGLPDGIALVIVGRHTPYADKIAEEARRLGLSQRVRLLHDVTDRHLAAFYQMAEAFVYPSVYEGFGIPIIEAISGGLPVVACTGSCLEEAGGPDCLYVAPDDVEGMTTALRQTLRGAEGRDKRILRSRQYIRRFEGSDVASQVADIYYRLL